MYSSYASDCSKGLFNITINFSKPRQFFLNFVGVETFGKGSIGYSIQEIMRVEGRKIPTFRTVKETLFDFRERS